MSENRGQNALQRRALQLKRWHELNGQDGDQIGEQDRDHKKRSRTRVQFSSKTLFLSSVSQNDFQFCESLLSSQPSFDVNCITSDGLTALHQLVIDENLEGVKWLLNQRGLDLNRQDNEGWTPLHAAASCAHLEIVRLLLAREELDVFAINCDGELARDVCDDSECVAAIDARMRSDLNLETCDDADADDAIPEHVLREMRRKEEMAIERDFQAFLARYKDSPTCETAFVEWIEATRDAISRATILHICAAKGYDECLKRIVRAIPEDDCARIIDSFVDQDGFTALHAAAFWQQMSTFETLLKFGANFELKTRDSRLVQDLCHENPKILELICETKKSRELKELKENNEKLEKIKTSETQRKLNAKRQRETRRPTQGVSKEDIELALKSTQNAVVDDSPAVVAPDVVAAVVPSLPSTPMPSEADVCVNISLPIQPLRRRQKRRSTGIDDNHNSTANEQPMSDEQTPEAPSVVTTTTTRDVDSKTSSSSTGTGTGSGTVPSLGQRSRSSSRANSTDSTTTSDAVSGKSEKREDGVEREDREERELDYKKLYKEVLFENEFLSRKTRDLEKKEKEFQEFSRERRQLVRRISELEEELKSKEELIKENLRLKDENSALIRVISKLSK